LNPGQESNTYEVGPCQAPLSAPFSWSPSSPARSRGQGGAPDWTNDLDAGEDRRRLLRREDPEEQAELVSHTPIRASKGKICMTVESGPGCSVKKVGRISGTVRFASGPGTEAFSEGFVVLAHLLEDVKAASEKLS
jgi:hypothetical protein